MAHCSCCGPDCAGGTERSNFKRILFLIALTLLLGAGIAIEHFNDLSRPGLFLLFYLAAYLMAGLTVLRNAARGLLRGDLFNENFLMAVATLGALVLGQYAEALGVMVFYQWGIFFESMAEAKSERSIKSLMSLRPDRVNVLAQDGQMREIPLEEAKVGDLYQLQAGNRNGLDAVAVEGSASIDFSALTGESVPRRIGAGQELKAGAVVKSGVLILKAQAKAADSSLERIFDLVKNAVQSKSRPERFVRRFARVYTPIVVLFCLLVALVPPILSQTAFRPWVERALTILVISCPCALVVSVPLGFFGGIGLASRQGVLFKGSHFLDAFNSLQGIAFDKTGTLTEGVFEVSGIVAERGAQEELLKLAAAAESYSNHPIALSLRQSGSFKTDPKDIADYQEIEGKGIVLSYKERPLIVGRALLLEERGFKPDPVVTAATAVHAAYGSRYLGYILIADKVKPNAAAAVAALRKRGLKVAMFTGDEPKISQEIAQTLGIDIVKAGLLPHEKVAALEAFMKEIDGKAAFVGDGINDAPCIARADVGLAMGRGADSSLETADAAILSDDPMALDRAFNAAKRTRRVVVQNIVFSLAVKILFIGLGALGAASMWEAVFADTGVLILAIFNSSRLLRKEKALRWRPQR